MFEWLFKKQIKAELDGNFKKLNFHLSNSFLNVKKDMDALSSDVSTSNEKFNQLEQRLSYIEKQILILFSQQQSPQIEKNENLSSPEIPLLNPAIVIEDLTYTQRTLLVTLYEYQNKLNSPISIKSLAKILYPDKNLGQVRTTITEYLDVLASHGLIVKTRKRRQSYAQVTENGQLLVKKLLEKDSKKLKKKQKVN